MIRNQKQTTFKATQAVILARVSTREQENGQSIDAQIEKIRRYCIQKNFNVAREFIITESSTRGERKKFYEMLDFVKKYPGKILIIADCVDRMQRNFNEHHILDGMRKADKIEIHFVRDGQILRKDSNSSEKMFWNMCVTMAQGYTDASSDNIKRSLDRMWDIGHYSGWAPLGYSHHRDETDKAYITIDSDTAPKVKKLFEAYNTGMYTLRDLEKQAKEMKLLSQKGNQLVRTAIHKILVNPFYYGIMLRKGKTAPHFHGNIISKELYDSVQERLVGKSSCSFQKGYNKEAFAFRGIIRCSCGSIMSPEKHTKKSGHEIVYVKCSHYHRDCTQKPVNEKILMEQVNEQIFDKLSITQEELALLKKLVRKDIEKERIEDVQAKKQTEGLLKEMATKKKCLLEHLLSNHIDAETYNAQKADYEAEELELKEEITRRSQIDGEIEQKTDCLIDFVANIREIFKGSKIEQKHQFLKMLVSNSLIEGKKLSISMARPFDYFVKTPDCIQWRTEGDSNPRYTCA